MAWIARDQSGDLWFYQERPIYKDGRWDSGGDCERIASDLFPELLPGHIAKVHLSEFQPPSAPEPPKPQYVVGEYYWCGGGEVRRVIRSTEDVVISEDHSGSGYAWNLEDPKPSMWEKLLPTPIVFREWQKPEEVPLGEVVKSKDGSTRTILGSAEALNGRIMIRHFSSQGVLAMYIMEKNGFPCGVPNKPFVRPAESVPQVNA